MPKGTHPALEPHISFGQKPKIPYGITKGEFYGKGTQKQWEHGKYRKQAESAESKHTLDENQTKEDDIRERQARLKNADAVAKATAKKKAVPKK